MAGGEWAVFAGAKAHCLGRRGSGVVTIDTVEAEGRRFIVGGAPPRGAVQLVVEVVARAHRAAPRIEEPEPTRFRHRLVGRAVKGRMGRDLGVALGGLEYTSISTGGELNGSQNQIRRP